ncbi:shikimate dehydrogenase [Saliterribacillus persicus]|uniref:Shikimate dehydrogenase (NADP(+)) n=1 Tax=Saliterribacillus persicus TaxID=930114 RepID=A0A368XDI7_9BACI|nr:shikimate dehydrogenase [Saliterribacillus persicus]RCW65296.1 shikimate dehydrogenase [Saliterribacillus persicus]
MSLSLGLIGNPIGHSLSPWIHTNFLEKANINGNYRLYEGDINKLPDILKKLRQNNIAGFNVTVPYKQTILPYIDDIDKDARVLGAVNTVLNDNGRWVGYNTDGQGYVRSVITANPSILNKDTKILMLGAGGAARGIYRALVNQDVNRIDIANRSEEKAIDLLHLNNREVKSDFIDFGTAEENLGDYDFIVQTTSVGMKPKQDNQIIKLDHLKKNALVSDIVYQPITTQLLKDAKFRGANIHHGHAMLLYQAQLAFEIWTGEKLNVENMLQPLEQKLRGEN